MRGGAVRAGHTCASVLAGGICAMMVRTGADAATLATTLRGLLPQPSTVRSPAEVVCHRRPVCGEHGRFDLRGFRESKR